MICTVQIGYVAIIGPQITCYTWRWHKTITFTVTEETMFLASFGYILYDSAPKQTCPDRYPTLRVCRKILQ